MILKIDKITKTLLRESLVEDGAWNDLTSKAILSGKKMGKGIISAKSDCVISGLPVVKKIYQILDKKVKFKFLKTDGDQIGCGESVAEIEGPGITLLSGERVALNFLSHLTGISTLTHEFITKLENKKISIFDTRKTTPLWRTLERYAVCMGGGQNHRFNLSKKILIKDNHLILGDGITNCINAVRTYCGQQTVIEVEVENLEQALEAAQAGADVILFDNISPQKLSIILSKLKTKAILEVSGGINLKNIHSYSKFAINRISVGALTHSAPAMNFSFEIEK